MVNRKRLKPFYMYFVYYSNDSGDLLIELFFFVLRWLSKYFQLKKNSVLNITFTYRLLVIALFYPNINQLFAKAIQFL